MGESHAKLAKMFFFKHIMVYIVRNFLDTVSIIR